MVKNQIKEPCSILDGDLCDKDWQLPVAVTGDLVLDAAGVLYPLLFYSYLLEIVCNLNLWC